MSDLGLLGRWKNYSSVGEVIPGTRFLAFKVPLKEELCNQQSGHIRFTPDCLLRHVRENDLDLCLVVDLTSSAYYDPAVLLDNGVRHVKLHVPWKEIPAESFVQRFFESVDEVLKNDQCKDKLVGVHCTHGVNRTGYIVCRYMIEKLGIPPADAIEAFGKARGHCIERNNYINDLLARSCDGKSGEHENKKFAGLGALCSWPVILVSSSCVLVAAVVLLRSTGRVQS